VLRNMVAPLQRISLALRRNVHRTGQNDLRRTYRQKTGSTVVRWPSCLSGWHLERNCGATPKNAGKWSTTRFRPNDWPDDIGAPLAVFTIIASHECPPRQPASVSNPRPAAPCRSPMVSASLCSRVATASRGPNVFATCAELIRRSQPGFPRPSRKRRADVGPSCPPGRVYPLFPPRSPSALMRPQVPLGRVQILLRD